LNRNDIADLIVKKIDGQLAELTAAYTATRDKIGYFYIDDLLPAEIAEKIFSCFPVGNNICLKKA